MSHPLTDRFKSNPRQWWLVITSGTLTLVCGSLGLWQYEHAHSENVINPVTCALSSLYCALQMLKRLANSSRTPDSDPSLRPWAALLDDFRESNRQQADHIGIKLRALGLEMTSAADTRDGITTFSIADIELLAEVEHRRWNAERWLAGWRYGTPSDKPNRINENLVSWNELHDSIKQYDRETITEIPKRLAAAKMKVVRKANR